MNSQLADCSRRQEVELESPGNAKSSPKGPSTIIILKLDSDSVPFLNMATYPGPRGDPKNGSTLGLYTPQRVQVPNIGGAWSQ